MNKRIVKRVICYMLTAAMLVSSVSMDTARSKAAQTGNAIIDGEYTTGIFAGSYGIDQLFDYIMSYGRLNNLPYDASWGHANASTGHQFTKAMMEGKHFVLKYSGDPDWPLALCLYEDDGTPVVSSRSSRFSTSSRIGLRTNVCLTSTAISYMQEYYTDGFEGVVTLGTVGKADNNGLYFHTDNGFGYYLSGNQGRDVGEYIRWESDADTDVTVEELAAMDGYASNSLQSGQYAVMYSSEGGAKLLNMPGEQTKEKNVTLTLSKKVPARKGYRFKEWNTKEDGTGTSYQPGAEYTKNAVVTLYAMWTRYYESGLFGAKLGKNQIFDNVTSRNMINGNCYDASYGDASFSSGHQFKDAQLEDRFFVFRYSGDPDWPVALFMYDEDGTPVTKSTTDRLPRESAVGEEDNLCLTTKGKAYMEDTYSDGIKGLLCQGRVEQYDENGVTFVSMNGFGYYASINRGYKKGDYIEWYDIVESDNVEVEELDAIDTFADALLFDGEYAIIYNENADDIIENFPETQKKKDLYSSIITMEQPVRNGYEFVGWNTKSDGTGDSYPAGARYTGKGVLTVYAIWEEEEKESLALYEDGKQISRNYVISNDAAVEKMIEKSETAEEFYSALNNISMTRILEIKGGYSGDSNYNAVSADENIAACQVEGNILTLSGKNDGFTYVTVTDEASGQICRLSVNVKTLKDNLFIIRPVTNDDYKDYLTDNNKVSYSAGKKQGKKVTWETAGVNAASVKQLSNDDCVVWKPALSSLKISAACGLNTTLVPIADMQSGEVNGAYPINNYYISSAYRQNITLADSTGSGISSNFTVKAFLIDNGGNILAEDTKTFTADIAKTAYSTDVSFDGVDSLENADVLLEVTAENNTYKPKLVQYPVYSKGQQVNAGTKIQLEDATSAVTDTKNIVNIADENGKNVCNMVLDKNDKKTIVVTSCSEAGHSIVFKVADTEVTADKEESIHYDGMVNEWKKSTFNITGDNVPTGRSNVKLIIRNSSNDIISTQTTQFNITNIANIPSPEKPENIQFLGDFDTPTLSAGSIINRSLKFNFPKYLPMKISYQDTDDPLKKTFMIAIGNAGLDEDNVVAAVTETINDLKDNNLTKTLSGYAFGNADFVNGKWVMTYTGGGIAGSIQYEFGFNNNVVVGFVPLYYGMKVGCTAKVDALLSGSNSYHNKFVGMDFSTNNLKLTSQYNFVTDILVGVQGYVGASGGVGFDGKVVKLKFGVEGQLSLEYDHRVVIFKDLDNTKTYDGGHLDFSGRIGLNFEFKLLFIKYKKEIVGTGFNTGKDFRDWSKFPAGRPNLLEFAGMQNENAKLLALAPKEDQEWYNYINPYISPVISGDGSSMAMTYTDSLDELDTVNPAISNKDGSSWSEPEVLTDWRTTGKKQTVNAIDYDTDGSLKVLAFDALSYDNIDAESDNISSDEFNNSANTGEIHVYVNGVHTQLTDNAVSDIAPVVSVRNGKAIVVWQSDKYNLDSINENAVKQDMQGEKKLYFSFYDGEKWSAPVCLENGEIEGVQAYDTAISDDGEAMVIASMGTSDLLKERELFSYIIDNGTIKSVNRITCNEYGETQPRVKYVTDNDGMFLAGWQQSEYENDSVKNSCVILKGFNKDGSANDFMVTDNGDITENFDFVKGGDTINSSAVCWYDTGADTLSHTYVKYINKTPASLSMKYTLNGTSSENESIVGSTVIKDEDSFTAVSAAQVQKENSQEDDTEQPARLIFSHKTIDNAVTDAAADAFDQNIIPSSNINVTISFTNAGRNAMNSITVKNNGTTVVDNYPVSVGSGENGQVKFVYALGEELKNEDFVIEADNGATATAKLVLLGTDIVAANPELTGTVSGGERIMQAVISNAGTAALKDTDKIYVNFSSGDNKNIKVNPLSGGAAWDEVSEQIIISGSDAIDAVNSGEYILQFGYKPEFDDDSDTVAFALEATAYNNSMVSLDELNVADNSASFSIVKPSAVYDTQLVYDAIIENGNITAVKVTNQYETAIKTGIKVSNGSDSKTINVNLAAEESKTYAVSLPVSDSLGYTVAEYGEDESEVILPSEKPSPAPSDTAEPSPAPTNTAGPTAAPSDTAEPSPAPTNTAGPTATPADTAQPSPTPSDKAEPTPTPDNTAEPTPVPTNTVKPTRTPRPTRTPVVTRTPRPQKTSAPVRTLAPRKTFAPATEAPEIKVGKASIKKLKNISKRKVVITVKPVAGARGYRIFYSTSKKFKNAKTRTIYGKKGTLAALKKGKTYYLKVQAFVKGYNGLNVYGKASKVKKIKIKK